MVSQKMLTRRRVLQSTGVAAGYMLVKPAITLAHQAGPDGLTIYAAAAAAADDAIIVLARHDDGFQLRKLTTEKDLVVFNEVVEDYFPESFWPLDLGVTNGVASSVIGSMTEVVPAVVGENELANHASAERSEILDEPYGPFATGVTAIHEIERPATWIDHNVTVMEGRGIVAARAEQHFRTVEVVLRPSFDDGDHLSAVTAVVDGSSIALPFANEQPVGSAAAFIRSDGIIIVAIDTVSRKLIVLELQSGQAEWQQLSPLLDTEPGSVSMSGGDMLTAVKQQANGDSAKAAFDFSSSGADSRKWKFAQQTQAGTFDRGIAPTNLIPVKGRAAWLARGESGQLQVNH